jgi:hypothetical protein
MHILSSGQTVFGLLRNIFAESKVPFLAELLCILFGLSLERLIKGWRRWRFERRFSLGREFLSRYEEKGVWRSAPVTLTQSGSKIKGHSSDNDRTWKLEGNISEDGRSLWGRYFTENRADGSMGIFFLQVQRNLDLDGYWLGKDPRQTEIQRGEYMFLQCPQITLVKRSDYPLLLDIARQQLGDSYLREADFHNSSDTIAVCARRENLPIGFGIAKILDAQSFVNQFDELLVDNSNGLRIVKQFIPNHGKLGYLASSAVASMEGRRGAGTLLVKRRIQELRSKGIDFLVATVWIGKEKSNAADILGKEHFKELVEVPNFWKSDSVKNNFSCPKCGPPPCVCSAHLYVRSFDK